MFSIPTRVESFQRRMGIQNVGEQLSRHDHFPSECLGCGQQCHSRVRHHDAVLEPGHPDPVKRRHFWIALPLTVQGLLGLRHDNL